MANHTSMMGPKTLPTAPVPRFWTMKRPVMMAIAMGTTHDSNDDETFSRPSTAERTEMAGVMTPSPYRRAVPKTPSATRTPARATRRCSRGRTRAVRARMPPSPLLSARITKNRYLTEMMMTSDQNAREQMP